MACSNDFLLKELERVLKLKNAAGAPLVSDNYQERKVDILPDPSVARGMFIPNTTIPGTYRAHPVTIKSMRKDILFTGEFLDLEIKYTCQSCQRELDLQFWILCPYCEGRLPKNPSHLSSTH